MKNNITLGGIAEMIEKAQSVLIICHKRPDGDTLGSAFAIKNAYPEKDILVMCIGIAIAVAVAVFAAVKSYPEDYDEAGKLLVDGAKMAKDTFKGVGWCIGFFVGWVLERRFVGFSTDVPMMTRITRFVTGLLSYYAVNLILSHLLKDYIPGAAGTILSCFLQMFYVSFLFPWCIKRFAVLKGTDPAVR